jgi:hypothetical protein
MPRFAIGLVFIAAAALVAALPAAAKEGVKATLTTHVPLGARAGTHLRVAWTLGSVDEHGKRQPFGATGVFVRLLSASGAPAETGVAPSGAYTTGEYAATVIVPKGGIGDVRIGLRGFTSGATGTHSADMIFPIVNDPVPGAALTHPGTHRSTESIVAAVVTTALALLAIALVWRRTSAKLVAGRTG